MNLEQYLEGLRTCPDELVGAESRLQRDFGIFDNYDIMLNERLGGVVVEFCTLTDFKLRNYLKGQFTFDYQQKKVSVQISSHNKFNDKLWAQHPILILLHPRHFGEITTTPLIQQHRDLAEVIQLIGRYSINNSISALFRPSYMQFPEDMPEREQVVIYNPEEGK